MHAKYNSIKETLVKSLVFFILRADKLHDDQLERFQQLPLAIQKLLWVLIPKLLKLSKSYLFQE